MAGASPSQQNTDKSRTTTQKSSKQPQTRTRNSTTSVAGRPSAEELLSDPTQAVKDAATAKSYLASTQYLSSTTEITVSQLIGILAVLATDKSITKQTANVIRAVALLLQSRDVVNQAFVIANAVNERLESLLEDNGGDDSPTRRSVTEIEQSQTETITKRLDEGLENMRKHITDSINSIVIPPPPPPPPMNLAPTYRDALMQNGLGEYDAPFRLTAGDINANRDFDPKRKARELSKAKQILI